MKIETLIVRGPGDLVAAQAIRSAVFITEQGMTHFEEFLNFAGARYAEMETDLEPVPGAITIASGGAIIPRPEGDWDRPGVFEEVAKTMTGNPAVSTAADDEVPRLIALVAAAFPALPIDARAVAEIHRWHRNVLAIKVNGEIAGCFAALFLNAPGEAAMIEESLPMIRPPPHLLSREGEKVAAVYVWMFVARKYGMHARPLILRWVSERAPGANIYGRPINAALRRLHSRSGTSSLFEGSPIWVLPNSHAASP